MTVYINVQGSAKSTFVAILGVFDLAIQIDIQNYFPLDTTQNYILTSS